MSEHAHIRADGTVTFLPRRLNRQPVVVRGLTADELWICCGLSGAGGLLVGLPLAWLLSTIALIPTLIVLGIVAGIFVGGGKSADGLILGCIGNCSGKSPHAGRCWRVGLADIN